VRQFQRITALCLLVVVAIVSTCPAEEFPYVAYVRTETATIHSGPDRDNYVTDRLVRGTKVEVYRHDGGMWCAIRPPNGSFAWVKRRQLKRTDDSSLATVIGEDVFAHVGTRLSDEHNVKYVKLSPGEVVEVLGTQRLSEPDGTSAFWYKAAPPAGEFRWIRLEHIERKPNVVAAVVVPEDMPTSESNAVAVVHAMTDSPEVNPTDDTGRGDHAVSVPSQHGTAGAVRSDGSDRWPPRDDSREDRPSLGDGILEDTGTLAYDLLDAIDLQLSLSVAQSPATWDLADLKRKTEAVIDTSSDTARRGRARDLLAKIAKFQDLQRRYLRLFGSADQPITDGLAVPGVLGATRADSIGTGLHQQLSGSEPTAGQSSEKNPYDGSGWLMRVITQHNGVPQYALTDQQGRILHFVTPSPGINLRRYERQEIGVVGRRGYIPRLKKPHLTAERIIVLDRHRR
jgi:uncharacterized protein YgiM (DUF1202 family)